MIFFYISWAVFAISKTRKINIFFPVRYRWEETSTPLWSKFAYFCGARDLEKSKFSATFFQISCDVCRCLPFLDAELIRVFRQFPLSIYGLIVKRVNNAAQVSRTPSRRRKERKKREKDKNGLEESWKVSTKTRERFSREELLPRGIFQSGRKGKKIELLSTDIDQAFLGKLRLPLCISFLQTRLRITKTFY